MKAIILALCLSFSLIPSAFAGPYDLQVRIRNLSTEQCKLTQSYLNHGVLINSDIPSILPATAELVQFNVSGNYSPKQKTVELSIRYQCGEHKYFTLYMKQYYKRRHLHSSTIAQMSDATEAFETHEIYLGNRDRFIDGRGLISWLIR
jgi:hypothetical protein